MNFCDELPVDLMSQLDLESVSDLGPARLGNRVLQVNTRDGKKAILKVGTGESGHDIRGEARRLEWLAGRHKAPTLLYSATFGDYSASLTQWLAARRGHEVTTDLPDEIIIAEYAAHLKAIHSQSVSDCPFKGTLEQELIESERRMRECRIDLEAFQADTGQSPKEVFDQLSRTQDLLVEDCFTHGDYCLPNVLFEGDNICGAIDWGLAGVADRHRDFMSAEITIKRNFEKDLRPLFYEHYGAINVNKDKIRYYWLLDRFFNHTIEPGQAA